MKLVQAENEFAILWEAMKFNYTSIGSTSKKNRLAAGRFG
ncbi:hypothetical protein SD77_4307 [Bacillus badius]|uniref:Uncharacterized protein n=1 Tax=Bacillus badius TaxID=1455 RepID=A0ABR5AV42_BACBA|nr:hypothetical protein SD78_0613 [Bacillus badius]KIL78627.1 hypothetical protein SD77_4307 [Bacillus badius]